MSALMEKSKLAALVEQLVDAKAAKAAAEKRVADIESAILAEAPAREEGATTYEVGGMKLTVTGKLNYSLLVGPGHLAAAMQGLDIAPPLKTETVLDSTGAKWIRANRPDLWRKLADLIEVKPAKTSITVKVA